MEKAEKDRLLEELMIAYGDELLRLAFAYVREKELAKDLVQNTFVKCYENLEAFRYEAQIRTWLYRIAINECKDYLKSWHYRKVQVKDILLHYRFTTSSVEQKVMKNANDQELREMVFSLPPKYREVISLYYFHSLKIGEIAEVTRLHVNTVKTRLRRAKQQLKSKLEEGENDGQKKG
ncbi:sigma-70 family RNA polymerase sigma factor [Alkalihalobacillus oceani]|uniref:Sigma-70 family RNA polymerase sigma factor n=1 Tax=Halalkalibacter oceani TaxID=1653776 RepID=A0A9X2DTM7_9BACI|nr:sigma-70 family RNA polymerase sigma factor [Halalkalibacter oceani]